MTFSFHSMGRQQVAGVREFLEKYCKFDMRQVAIIDAVSFPQPGRRAPSEGHCGMHEHIWHTVATAQTPNGGDLLLQVCCEIFQACRTLPPDVRHVKVVFVCNWGKHRSVALSEMFTEALAGTGLCNAQAEHLSYSCWSRWKCGKKECFCFRMTTDKFWCCNLAFQQWCEASKAVNYVHIFKAQ